MQKTSSFQNFDEYRLWQKILILLCKGAKLAVASAAVGHASAVGKIDYIFIRHKLAQPFQCGKAAKTGVINSNSSFIHFCVYASPVCENLYIALKY